MNIKQTPAGSQRLPMRRMALAAHVYSRRDQTPTVTKRNVIRIATEFLLWLVCRLSTEFGGNGLSSCCLILLTNKLTT